MLLVVDANVVFSALIRRSKPLKVFELNKLLMKFEFIAPEFLFFEVGKRVDKILKFTEFSKEEFIKVFSFIKRIKEELKLKMPEEFEDTPDILFCDEVDLFALPLKLDCPIWAQEKAFKKQSSVKVFATSDLFSFLSRARP